MIQSSQQELQSLIKSGRKTEDDKKRMLKLRNRLASTITMKRQSFNNVVSEYVKFCFSMNLLISISVFALNAISYVSSPFTPDT